MNATARRVGGEAVPPEYAGAVQAAKSDWTRFDADKILMVLEETEAGGQALSGTVMSGGETPKGIRLSYHSQRGLIIDR